jgi:SNF2 family DNA or RNA helicase
VPRTYQETAIALGVSQACLGLLLDPGLGKTTIIYAIYKILRDLGYVKRMLVVAPLKVAQNVWPVQKYEWEQFRDLSVTVLHGSKKDKLLLEQTDIHVINPDGLEWLTGAKFIKLPEKKEKKLQLDEQRMKWIKENYDILVVDESTKFKHSSSNRFKIMKQMVPRFKRRYILTGTISPNGLMDLFGQMYILDEGYSLGQYITHYRNKYFTADPHVQGVWHPVENAAEKIAERIAPLTLRMKREDHLQMPKLIFQDIWVDLPPKAMAEYKRMEDELVALVEAGAVIASNAAVATGKCRQIANGAVYTDDKGRYEVFHKEKLEALQDLVEAMCGQPLLVAYSWKFDLEMIQKEMKIPAIGQGTDRQDASLISEFNRGTLPTLLGHPETMALGLNLQGSCNHICWYGVPWNLEHYLQTIDRIYRQGQRAETVIVHRILARGTLDERMLQVLDTKGADMANFMNLLQNLRQ